MRCNSKPTARALFSSQVAAAVVLVLPFSTCLLHRKALILSLTCRVPSHETVEVRGTIVHCTRLRVHWMTHASSMLVLARLAWQQIFPRIPHAVIAARVSLCSWHYKQAQLETTECFYLWRSTTWLLQAGKYVQQAVHSYQAQ